MPPMAGPMSPSNSTRTASRSPRRWFPATRSRPASSLRPAPSPIILDSEKPHPATLAKLKASADNEPGKNLSQADLAEFYIDRGTARSALGRNMEALADGEKALAA